MEPHPDTIPKRINLWGLDWRVELRRRSAGLGAFLIYAPSKTYYGRTPDRRHMGIINGKLAQNGLGKVVSWNQIWINDVNSLTWLSLGA